MKSAREKTAVAVAVVLEGTDGLTVGEKESSIGRPFRVLLPQHRGTPMTDTAAAVNTHKAELSDVAIVAAAVATQEQRRRRITFPHQGSG